MHMPGARVVLRQRPWRSSSRFPSATRARCVISPLFAGCFARFRYAADTGSGIRGVPSAQVAILRRVVALLVSTETQMPAPNWLSFKVALVPSTSAISPIFAIVRPVVPFGCPVLGAPLAQVARMTPPAFLKSSCIATATATGAAMATRNLFVMLSAWT